MAPIKLLGEAMAGVTSPGNAVQLDIREQDQTEAGGAQEVPSQQTKKAKTSKESFVPWEQASLPEHLFYV